MYRLSVNLASKARRVAANPSIQHSHMVLRSSTHQVNDRLSLSRNYASKAKSVAAHPSIQHNKHMYTYALCSSHQVSSRLDWRRNYAAEDRSKEEAIRLVLKRVEHLADVVKVKKGPNGRSVVIELTWGSPTAAKYGDTFAKSSEFKEKVKNIGAILVKQVANVASDVVVGCVEHVIKEGVTMAVDSVKSRARMITANKIKQVGTISANELGGLIAKAIGKAGTEGVNTIQQHIKIKSFVSINRYKIHERNREMHQEGCVTTQDGNTMFSEVQVDAVGSSDLVVRCGDMISDISSVVASGELVDKCGEMFSDISSTVSSVAGGCGDMISDISPVIASGKLVDRCGEMFSNVSSAVSSVVDVGGDKIADLSPVVTSDHLVDGCGEMPSDIPSFVESGDLVDGCGDVFSDISGEVLSDISVVASSGVVDGCAEFSISFLFEFSLFSLL